MQGQRNESLNARFYLDIILICQGLSEKKNEDGALRKQIRDLS